MKFEKDRGRQRGREGERRREREREGERGRERERDHKSLMISQYVNVILTSYHLSRLSLRKY